MSSSSGPVWDPLPHRRTVAVLRVLAIASIIGPLLLLAAGGFLEWRQQHESADAETDRLLALVADSSTKLFEAQLLALEQAVLLVRNLDDAALNASEFEIHTRLSDMMRHLPFVRNIFVADRYGHALVDAYRYPAPSAFSVAGRDYFDYFRNGGTGRFIGRLGYRYSDGLPFVPFTVKRPAPAGSDGDGTFTGVVTASINPEFFETFFRQVLSTYPDYDDRSISLRRADGHLLARSQQLTPPQNLATQLVSAEMINRTGATSGKAISDKLGERRIVAWQRLPDLGLVLFTSVSLDGILRGWIRTMIPYTILCLGCILALFGMTVIAMRRTKEAISAELHMADERRRRQQAEDAAHQAQKMEALGKLTGGVAHDFNNILAVIQGNAELAKTRPPDKVSHMLDNVLHAAQRGAMLTRQLLSFSRGQALSPRVIDPRAELTRIMEILRPVLQGDIDIETIMEGDPWLVEIDPGEWEIALLNIAVNARDAMPNGGHLTITVENLHLQVGALSSQPELNGDFVQIALQDNGPGIPPEVARRAFEPFYTTKDIGRGTGLGLSQVYGFARQSGGTATIASAAGGGTVVTMYLPRALRRDKEVSLAEPAAEPSRVYIPRILFVEDNQEVAAIASEIISSLGYEIVHVDRARPALDMLLREQYRFSLLMTDIVMPDGMNGLDLAKRIRKELPSLPIILVSGYNDAWPDRLAGCTVLRKPLPVEQLAQVLETELGARVPANAKAG